MTLSTDHVFLELVSTSSSPEKSWDSSESPPHLCHYYSVQSQHPAASHAGPASLHGVLLNIQCDMA